eukprot:6720380-Pyramimonas_sp.AAC.1
MDTMLVLGTLFANNDVMEKSFIAAPRVESRSSQELLLLQWKVDASMVQPRSCTSAPAGKGNL